MPESNTDPAELIVRLLEATGAAIELRASIDALQSAHDAMMQVTRDAYDAIFEQYGDPALYPQAAHVPPNFQAHLIELYTDWKSAKSVVVPGAAGTLPS